MTFFYKCKSTAYDEVGNLNLDYSIHKLVGAHELHSTKAISPSSKLDIGQKDHHGLVFFLTGYFFCEESFQYGGVLRCPSFLSQLCDLQFEAVP